MFLAVQRGSLSRLLEWLHLGLKESANGRKVSKLTVQSAIRQIKSADASKLSLADDDDDGAEDESAVARFRLACTVDEESVDLREAVLYLLSLVVDKCGRYTSNCVPSKDVEEVEDRSKTRGAGAVFTWGTNYCPGSLSDRQQSLPASDKLFVPTKMAKLSDAQKVDRAS